MEKKKARKGVLRIILFVCISVVLGIGIYSFNAQSVTGNAMPMPFGMGMGVVMSDSMEPELHKDDFILVAKRDAYEVGEVVVYQDRRLLVVHEIVCIDGDMVITKGTANDCEDEPIDMSAIKGEVVWSVKGAGKVIRWIKSPVVTISILGIAFWLLIKSYATEKSPTDEVQELKKEIERLKGEDNQ